MRASMCKYVRQNTVITARLIPPVRTLLMKINPLGLEEKVKGCEYKKIEKKQTRDESWLFLDALASLGSMLESERLIHVFEILSNLGHIFRVGSEYVQSRFRVCSE